MPAPGPGYPGHEVHEEGEEGEGRGEQGVLVEELDQVVQPRIPVSTECTVMKGKTMVKCRLFKLFPKYCKQNLLRWGF